MNPNHGLELSEKHVYLILFPYIICNNASSSALWMPPLVASSRRFLAKIKPQLYPYPFKVR